MTLKKLAANPSPITFSEENTMTNTMSLGTVGEWPAGRGDKDIDHVRHTLESHPELQLKEN